MPKIRFRLERKLFTFYLGIAITARNRITDMVKFLANRNISKKNNK
jgi:hypothetical protein